MAAHTPVHPDPVLSLAMAVVASSTAPLLLLDGELMVIAASTSFCRAFHLTTDRVAGRTVFELGHGEWNLPRLRSLLVATANGSAAIEAYELDLQTPENGKRRLVLNAQLLTYAGDGPVRMVLSVADVTDARLAEKLKDDLVREKTLLLQEVQHRVANSLQIIASVLLQNARKVGSDESRGHLQDAHHRVMSVAAVQKQLAVSEVGEVELRGYFTNLCASIAASMISDHDRVSLKVTGDDSTLKADLSVSLGLIVTELVINALKHAFPGQRGGKIGVDYRSQGTDWTLMVTDDGVGMDTGPGAAKAGLGTSIVEAVARQLDARVQVADARPGTEVSVVHDRASSNRAPFHAPA